MHASQNESIIREQYDAGVAGEWVGSAGWSCVGDVEGLAPALSHTIGTQVVLDHD